MKRKIYLIIFCCLTIAFLAVLPDSMNRRLDSMTGAITSPFISLLDEIEVFVRNRSVNKNVRHAKQVEMAVELERVRYQIARINFLEEENLKLRNMLDLAERSSHKLVAANVVARNVGGWWRKIHLDKGALHDIKPDFPVVGASGLVGRTLSVSSHRTDVLLMSDPSCRISVKTTTSDAFGILRGHGISIRDDALCKMEFISKGADITVGDDVVTSGLGGVYPAGIPVGRVQSIYVDDSGLYKNADIIPAIDFRMLDIVFVAIMNEGFNSD